jgi:hypothetical protein
MLVGVTEIEARTGAGFTTVIDALADLPPADAVMLTEPGATALTMPPATEATAVFEETQANVVGTGLPLASSAVATIVLVPPTVIVDEAE